jgi:hypothetical protein
MQTPDSAHQPTAKTGGEPCVAGDLSARQSEARAMSANQVTESVLRQKARRLALLLMGASILFALTFTAGAWLFIRHLR